MDFYKKVNEFNFEETESILSILKYVYGDLPEFWYLYDILRIYKVYQYEQCYLKALNDNSIIYFIKDKKTNLVKIGCSQNFERRIKQLKTRYETDFEVLYKLPITGNMFEYEALFHTLFYNNRVKGEFFNLAEEDINKIKSFKLEGKNYNEIKKLIFEYWGVK